MSTIFKVYMKKNQWESEGDAVAWNVILILLVLKAVRY